MGARAAGVGARNARFAGLFAGSLAFLGAALAGGDAHAAPAWGSIPLADVSLPSWADRPTTVPAAGNAPDELRLFPGPNAQLMVVPRDAGDSPQLGALTPPNRAQLRTDPRRSACVSFGNSRDAFRQSLLYLYRDSGTSAVRVETLDERPDGSATLHVADFWVDGKTHGVTSARAPVDVQLARMTSANEPAVYGYRVEGPAPKAEGAAKDGEGATTARSTSLILVMGATQRSNFRLSSGRVLSSQCGIAFGEIEVQTGGGTMVGELTRRVQIEETLPASAPAGAVPTRMPFDRNLSVTASVSQTSADPQPLLSIQTRWTTEMPPRFTEQRL